MTSFDGQRTIQSRGRVEPFYPPPAGPSETPWTITIYNAVHERERWQRYTRVANRVYAARGLQTIGEQQDLDIDRYPTYFAEATLHRGSGDGEPIGGLRIHTPDSCGGLPLLDELEGYIDIQLLQELMDELHPHGISHGGGLWIDPVYSRSGLAGDLARAAIPILAATQTRWCLGTAHQHVLDAWRSLGWHPVSTIPYFPYPDDRYKSCVVLNDCHNWPSDLVTWASVQVGNVMLDGAGARFTIKRYFYP